MVDECMFSSDNSCWGTPQELFDRLNAIFEFDFDACANGENAKMIPFISEEMDALGHDWGRYGETAWMNPPYARGITGKWVEHASRQLVEVVALLPSRTGTKWFQTVWAADALVFVTGRIKFEGAANGAPFDSVIAIFNRGLSKSEVKALSEIGRVVLK